MSGTKVQIGAGTEPLGDGVVPLIVPATTDHVALGGHAVSVAAPLVEKGCVVHVVWV